MTAFACLQAVTHKRHSSSLKYTIKYRGFVPLKVLESEDEVSQNNCQSNRPFLIQEKKAACEVEFSCTLKVRRSKSFSFLPNENTVPSGVVELLDQSSDLGKGVHSNIGDQAFFDRLPTRSRSSAASSPPGSPVPSWVGIEDTLEYSKDFIPKESTFIPLIYRFMRYSTAAYGSNFIRLLGMASWDDVEMPVHHPNVHSFSKHTSLPIDSIIYSSFSSVNSCFSSGPGGLLEPANLHPLVHYVTVDHGVRAVVLTCRGTLGISDALTDLTCEYDPVQVGDKTFLAHSGILSTARALADVSSEVHSVIRKALEDYPDYGLTLCGHSLGGGVVSLISMLWTTRSVDEFGDTSFALGPHSRLPAGRPVYCYTYGSPSVISYEGSVYLQGLVTSIVYGSDLVPSLSLGTLRDFKNVATTLADEENLIQQIITRSLGISGKLLNTDVPLQQVTSDVSDSSMVRSANASDDWFWSLIKTMRADMQSEKLYPPGEIYHITSCTTPVDLARVVRQSEKGNCPKRSLTIPALTTGSSHSSVQCLEVTLKRCENTINHFREINFSCTMFSDHSPRAYEDSLKALVASLSLGEL
ncbi:hypothetical protein DSO57_1032364 [Entomophthora muscae]|uniref:Uncharacterized protein n=1 Tax=Entomophthora muscae TaxID=34485 RepID=A0ACC2UAV0_9FUNG|nr:hypothetical protein DSO57_1032364 [Entomophthora muscae]